VKYQCEMFIYKNFNCELSKCRLMHEDYTHVIVLMGGMV
jgi:hypothetical protein